MKKPGRIGKRVHEALRKMQARDYSDALIHTSIAVDATAKRLYGRRGRKGYKDFVKEYLNLILIVGSDGLLTVENGVRLAYTHPDVKKDADGCSTIEDILYHVVRCSLLHEGGLPSNLRFTSSKRISLEKNALVLPRNLILGLLMAVIVCHVNRYQSLAKEWHVNIGAQVHLIGHFWGEEARFLSLIAGSAGLATYSLTIIAGTLQFGPSPRNASVAVGTQTINTAGNVLEAVTLNAPGAIKHLVAHSHVSFSLGSLARPAPQSPAT